MDSAGGYLPAISSDRQLLSMVGLNWKKNSQKKMAIKIGVCIDTFIISMALEAPCGKYDGGLS